MGERKRNNVIIIMTQNDKKYSYSILKNMEDGDEIMIEQCKIDWPVFIECTKIIMDRNILWGSGADFHIIKNGMGVRCVKIK